METNLKRLQLRVHSKMCAEATSATASKEIKSAAEKSQIARVCKLFVFTA